jgi:DNA-binding IclR family transcriptional regulator
VVSFNWLGRRDPINCTSSGKVLLAFLPKQQKNDLAKYGFSNCTQHSYSDPTQLETQLELIRQRGYGYTLEELELGLNAVAAPIFDQNAAVIASICVSGPSYRLSETKIHAVGKLTQQAAQQISEKLGFRGS